MRRARSLFEAANRDFAGRRTSSDEPDGFMLFSDAAGVGPLLVAGVEYSLSVEASRGVGTEETDSLPMTDALLGRPRGRLMLEDAASAVEGDATADPARSEALEGLPLGLLVAGVGSPEISMASGPSSALVVLTEPERVVRPLTVSS